MLVIRLVFLSLLFVLLAFPCLAMGADEGGKTPLKVYYLEFPPYYFTNSSLEPDGFLFAKADLFFRRAGVQIVYESMPARRILQYMRTPEPLASIGWFKTPEREKFARFSVPIYRNKPLQIAYLKKNAALFERASTLAGVLGDKSLCLGLPQGYSFGAEVDRMIKAQRPSQEKVSGGLPQLIRMLAAERFDYLLVAPEELDRLIEKNRLSRDIFMSKSLQGMPPGNVRYLMFNKAVPDSIIKRVNKAILVDGKVN